MQPLISFAAGVVAGAVALRLIRRGKAARTAEEPPAAEPAPVPVVVPKAGVTLTAEEIRAHVAGHLAGYKVPKQVFVADGLPKNPSGKILKRELRSEYAEKGHDAP